MLKTTGDEQLSKLTMKEAHHIVQDVMATYHCPWCVAGGWALDFHRNRQTRFHCDIEVTVLRCDLEGLYEAIKDRHPLAVFPGPDLRPWNGEALPEEVHQLRIDPIETSVGKVDFDFFLNPNDEDRWVSRRDPRITLPVNEIWRPTRGGTPALVPEIVFFFKAKNVREKDQGDFDSFLSRLEPRAKAWLKGALETAHPGHAWIERL